MTQHPCWCRYTTVWTYIYIYASLPSRPGHNGRSCPEHELSMVSAEIRNHCLQVTTWHSLDSNMGPASVSWKTWLGNPKKGGSSRIDTHGDVCQIAMLMRVDGWNMFNQVNCTTITQNHVPVDLLGEMSRAGFGRNGLTSFLYWLFSGNLIRKNIRVIASPRKGQSGASWSWSLPEQLNLGSNAQNPNISKYTM